jgi:glutathione synthase
MGLRVALQMDPLESIDVLTDSTHVLAVEGAARGHDLYHYGTHDLSLYGDRVSARVRPLSVGDRAGAGTLGPAELADLSGFDVVLMRQDPPFDMAYITATHILEHIHPKTLVVNDPVSVRNAPEKLFGAHFVDLMPPTLITSDREQIRAFRDEHRDIMLKPLYGNGGAGVLHIAPEDENLNALIEIFGRAYREPVVVQRYLPRVRQGDKRIILIDGEPAGAILRTPAKGEARSNLHVGGTAAKTTLDHRDREICAALGPVLREQGLLFVGIDIISGFLIEVNVTSPTGIQEVNRFDGVKLEVSVWDAIEAHLASREAA